MINMKNKIVILSVLLIIIASLSGCTSQERTARVTVTKESKGVFTVEIQQGSTTQIFLRYVEFTYRKFIRLPGYGDSYYVYYTEKVTSWKSSGSEHYTTITVDISKSPSHIQYGERVPKYKGGTVTFVFNDWRDIKK